VCTNGGFNNCAEKSASELHQARTIMVSASHCAIDLPHSNVDNRAKLTQIAIC